MKLRRNKRRQITSTKGSWLHLADGRYLFFGNDGSRKFYGNTDEAWISSMRRMVERDQHPQSD